MAPIVDCGPLPLRRSWSFYKGRSFDFYRFWRRRLRSGSLLSGSNCESKVWFSMSEAFEPSMYKEVVF